LSVDATDNIFRYSPDDSGHLETLTLAPGAFIISDNNAQVKLDIDAKGDAGSSITIGANN
jgi:hypothetical protein